MKRKRAFKRWRRRSVAALAGALGPLVLRVLGATWRVRILAREHWDQATRDGKLPVCALWHESIPIGAVVNPDRQMTVMISRHGDGEVIARIIERLGYRTARGSTFDGSVAALKAMLRETENVRALVLTPDGPRGPAHSISPGALYLAAATGRPLMASGFAVSRAWRARSWDRMIFPKPFARVVAVYGEPLAVPEAALRDEAVLAEARDELARRFVRAHEVAAEALQGRGAAPHSGAGEKG